MLAPVKCSVRAESLSQGIQKISASISPCAQISREDSTWMMKSVPADVRKTPLRLRFWLQHCPHAKLYAAWTLWRNPISFSVSSEGAWSLGTANKGFSFNQALRKETLWSQSQWVSPPHWLFMEAIFRITDGKCIMRSDCYSHKDRSGWSRHITCKTQDTELCLANWQSRRFVLPHYLSNPIHSGKLDHVL